MMENKLFLQRYKNILSFAILIIIALIAGLLIFFVGGDNEKNKNKQEINESNETTDGFPNAFYSYLGTVKEIDDKQLIVLAEAKNNYLKNDEEIKITFDEKTEILEIAIPKELKSTKNDNDKNIFVRVPVDSTKIEVGNEITAISFENIKGKLLFKADIIEIRKIQ